MTVEELADILRSPKPLIACDTSAVWGSQRRGERNFTEAWIRLARWRSNQLHANETIFFVPAAVWAEKLHDGRLGFGGQFSEDRVADTLESAGGKVVDFTAEDASQMATWLAKLFPSTELWQEAKQNRILRHHGAAAKSDCPATVDWLIAGQANARGWVLITNDTGIEFQQVQRAGLDDFLLAVELIVGKGPDAGVRTGSSRPRG